MQRFASVVRALCVLSLIAGFTAAHPDRIEDRLIFHFAVGIHAIQNGIWQDANHEFPGQVEGTPAVETHGPAEGLRFNGRTDWIRLAASLEEVQERLPRREFSVAAWVCVDQTQPEGGICGVLPLNPGSRRGWRLGYDDDGFTFVLCQRAPPRDRELSRDDAAATERVTSLRAKSPLRPGCWSYVAGTYDGHVARLYVNGELQAESATTEGDIYYPDQGEWSIGRGRVEDANPPLRGILSELKAYRRALSAEEIRAIAEKNANLIAFQAPEAPTLDFLVRPYLQFATTTSMKILCETTLPATMRIEYGERAPLTSTAKAAAAATISEIQLEGLKPGTAYFYRVTCSDAAGNEIHGPQASFQTAPGPGLPWSFGIIGDTQRNPDVTRRCAQLAYALRPNFMLHCGDVVDDGFAKNQWLKDLFEPCAILFAHTPVFPVIGNHEQDSHWYYDYFSLPAPEYYYTFLYGNAQFFMIDSNKPLTPGSEQYLWLEKELAASTATWKFTCHHHPCFSSDENDYGDHVLGTGTEAYTWGDPNAQHLVPLYEKYGVDIAFNGHIHVYERTWPIYQMTINQKKGVRYLTSGGGGGGLEQAAPQRAWFSLHFKRAHHICYVTIHDRTIQLKAYDIEDRLFDTFELTKPE